jgi:hypothetical protein
MLPSSTASPTAARRTPVGKGESEHGSLCEHDLAEQRKEKKNQSTKTYQVAASSQPDCDEPSGNYPPVPAIELFQLY